MATATKQLNGNRDGQQFYYLLEQQKRNWKRWEATVMTRVIKFLICNKYTLYGDKYNTIHNIMILSQLKNVTDYHLTSNCHHSVNF